MQIIEFLKNLDPNSIIIVLILLVLLLQIIQAFRLRKIKKPVTPNSGEKSEEGLKRFITSEMNRLKQEIISSVTRPPSEPKKDWEYLFPGKKEKQEEEIAAFQPAQLKENEPLPAAEPIETHLPPIPRHEESEFKPIVEEMELKPMEEEMDFNTTGDIIGGDDLQTCVDQYNEAISKEDSQSRFLDKYRPLRVDVVNALERRRRADLAPQYQTADNGDYYVVELINMGRTTYVVLPRFDLVIKESNYKAGAFGEVFDCPDYEQNERYRINRVVKPAYFEKKRNDSWELAAKGRIMLLLE